MPTIEAKDPLVYADIGAKMFRRRKETS